jgi:hypothetical protein
MDKAAHAIAFKSWVVCSSRYQTEDSDEFIVKVATRPNEITELLEFGFEHIMTKVSLAYFRRCN